MLEDYSYLADSAIGYGSRPQNQGNSSEVGEVLEY